MCFHDVHAGFCGRKRRASDSAHGSAYLQSKLIAFVRGKVISTRCIPMSAQSVLRYSRPIMTAGLPRLGSFFFDGFRLSKGVEFAVSGGRLERRSGPDRTSPQPSRNKSSPCARVD